MVPEDAYETVRQYIKDQPERLGALEIFHCYDRITSSPQDFAGEDVATGSEVAGKLKHAGCRAYFLTLQAQLLHQSGDVPEARGLTLEALRIYLTLATEDAAYAERASTVALNAISFTAWDGELASAREILVRLGRTLAAPAHAELDQLFGDAPVYDPQLSSVSRRASDLLALDHPMQALEWFMEAERLARAEGNEAELCGLLGDKAVAFRRLGNTRRAATTYQEAIELSRAYEDWVNLSRWSQNLGLIYLDHGDRDAAMQYFTDGIDAALKSGNTYQVSTAAGNFTKFLADGGRCQEALDYLEQAIATKVGDQTLEQIWRSNKFTLYQLWGTRLQDEGQVTEALQALTSAIAWADVSLPEEKRAVAPLYASIAALYYRLNDPASAQHASEEAIRFFRELGNHRTAQDLEVLYRQLSDARLKVRPANDTTADLEQLEQAIAHAVAGGDQQEEAQARVEFLQALLAKNDDRAVSAFEETLALVRRLQHRRQELILCLNFAPHFLGRGQTRRALTLAERAVELAERAGRPQSLRPAQSRHRVGQRLQ
jgi:tetratricopeptide (TPR) repeat protein